MENKYIKRYDDYWYQLDDEKKQAEIRIEIERLAEEARLNTRRSEINKPLTIEEKLLRTCNTNTEVND